MKSTYPTAPRTLIPFFVLGLGGLLTMSSGCGDKERKTSEVETQSEAGGAPGAGGVVVYGGAQSAQGGTPSGGADGVGGATGYGGAPLPSCSVDSDCTDPQRWCDRGRGQCAQCLTTFHCGATEVCRGGACVTDTACSADLPCGAGLVCNKSGLCTQCVTAGDCRSGESCIGFECRPACGVREDCAPYGLTCDVALGACIECRLDGDCPSEHTCTTGGMCVVGAPAGEGGSGSGGAGQAGDANLGGSGDGLGGDAGSGNAGAAGSMGGSTDGGAGGGEGGGEMGGDAGAGGVITEVGCGNGKVEEGETCDDGNVTEGDCCSALCVTEEGCLCTQVTTTADTVDLPITYRDFSSEHADFEPGASGLEAATTGLVETTLDAEGKPVLVAADTGYITSSETFAEWYRDVPGVNGTTESTIRLWKSGDLGYVNRADATGGSQFISWQNITYCEASDCAGCSLDGGLSCLSPCTPWGNDQTCTALRVLLDGDPYFFPIDDAANNVTPESELSPAALAPAYGGDWSAQPGGALHNFHFTSEIRFRFRYNANQAYSVDFLGDDDAWVFVNGQLAIDLGGIHTPVQGTTTLAAADFGLEDGGAYEVVVLQAERQTEGSTYRLTLSGFDLGASVCTK